MRGGLHFAQSLGQKNNLTLDSSPIAAGITPKAQRLNSAQRIISAQIALNSKGLWVYTDSFCCSYNPSFIQASTYEHTMMDCKAIILNVAAVLVLYFFILLWSSLSNQA
jgi:hypothetical protein